MNEKMTAASSIEDSSCLQQPQITVAAKEPVPIPDVDKSKAEKPSEEPNFKDFFQNQLLKLTDCAKPTINALTRICDEKSAEHSQQIVAILQDRFSSAEQNKKLPFLYLIDSIIKNIREPYLTMFQKGLRELFLNNFRSLTDSKVKSSFLRVLQTWQYLLDADLVKSIEMGVFGANIPKNYGGISPELLNTYIRDIGAKPAAKGEAQPSGASGPQSASLPLEDTFSLLKALQQSLKLPQVPENPLGNSLASLRQHSGTSDGGVSGKTVSHVSSGAFGGDNGGNTIPSFIGKLHQINMQHRSSSTGNSSGYFSERFEEEPKHSNSAASGGSDRSFTVLLAASDKKDPIPIPNDYVISSDFINRKYKNAHNLLYKDLKTKCSNCGLRFRDNSLGKSKYSVHLDWHFARNRRLRDKFKRPVSRDWFCTVEEWIDLDCSGDAFAGERRTAPLFGQESSDSIRKRAESKCDSGSSTAGESSRKRGLPCDDLSGSHSSKTYKESTHESSQNEADSASHFVPTRLAYDQKSCIVCGDKFSLSWNEENDEWVFDNAIIDPAENTICHYTCRSKDTSGAD